MFTGIIQTVGSLRSIRRTSTGARLIVDAPALARPIPDGASVCVAGVCLTATTSDPVTVTFDVVPETLSRSTLGSATPGTDVNLERSLCAGDGLDGHIVQGHVDGIAEVKEIRRDDAGHRLTLAVGNELTPYLIPKGSVAIDGVSLTLADVGPDTLTVALIPTTAEATTLGRLRTADRVNIETDIIARTVVSTMRRWRDGSTPDAGITMDMLREQGFA